MISCNSLVVIIFVNEVQVHFVVEYHLLNILLRVLPIYADVVCIFIQSRTLLLQNLWFWNLHLKLIIIMKEIQATRRMGHFDRLLWFQRKYRELPLCQQKKINLVWHSHNILLSCIIMKYNFIIKIIFIFKLYFLCFVLECFISFYIYCL